MVLKVLFRREWRFGDDDVLGVPLGPLNGLMSLNTPCFVYNTDGSRDTVFVYILCSEDVSSILFAIKSFENHTLRDFGNNFHTPFKNPSNPGIGYT